MKYEKTISLKDGRTCCLRSGTPEDAAAVLANFNLTHAQTDWLLTYPDENSFTEEKEEGYLKEKYESDHDVEIIAELDGLIVGTAGIDRIGKQEKIRHRAEFGISIDKAFWGLGIGRALAQACIECAKAAGYVQLELSVVAANSNAIKLYESLGFVEYGRNPLGFRSRISGWQEIVLMRLELSEVS